MGVQRGETGEVHEVGSDPEGNCTFHRPLPGRPRNHAHDFAGVTLRTLAWKSWVGAENLCLCGHMLRCAGICQTLAHCNRF